MSSFVDDGSNGKLRVGVGDMDMLKTIICEIECIISKSHIECNKTNI